MVKISHLLVKRPPYMPVEAAAPRRSRVCSVMLRASPATDRLKTSAAHYSRQSRAVPYMPLSLGTFMQIPGEVPGGELNQAFSGVGSLLS
jgi:hypothetical protein